MSVKDRKRDLYIRFRGRIVIKISFWGFILFKGRYFIVYISDDICTYLIN